MGIRNTALAVLAAGLGTAGCSPPTPVIVPAVPVTAAIAERADLPLSIRAVGTVEPIESAAVRAQVGGSVQKVAIREGQEVSAGQLLFEIDPRPYQASAEQARARLERDRAQLANAEAQLRRYQALAADALVSKEKLDTAMADAQALRAAVAEDEATIAQARLNLNYAAVRAPIAGRTGAFLITKGNVVKANDLPLLVINQIRPIDVRFAVPGPVLPQIQRYMAQGELTVRAKPSRASGDSLAGKLVFVDNAVDNRTGTLTLKGRFDNSDGMLWPGQFVDVELVLTIEKGLLIVPEAAVQAGQQGTYVFVVAPDGKAARRPVEVVRQTDGLAVIARGIVQGETVVTDGQLRLVEGSRVQIKVSAGPAEASR